MSRSRANAAIPKPRVLGLSLCLLSAASQALTAPLPDPQRYTPKSPPKSPLAPILTHLRPGSDLFPTEATAGELTARLGELGALLRDSSPHEVAALLTADFRGGRLVPAEPTMVTPGPQLAIARADAMPADLVRDRASFAQELSAFTADMATVLGPELLLTGLDLEGANTARTVVRYDVVGTGPSAWRTQRVGHWRMEWRKEGGAWRVARWIATDDVRSQATVPVFTEVTESALGANASYREQLVPLLDDWRRTLDGAFTIGAVGHHGVAVGDIDGDGLDDFYLCQPAGLPNRLFRNRGNGTFEDVTEAAGVGILDSSSAALFADLDSDGDQDLVVITRTEPLFFVNDDKGRFAARPKAFRFAREPQGSLISAAVADYDRDGDLDLYVCAYSFFIGAGEGKAGPPTPYHDAQNGPANVLFRNDGPRGFEDVTEAVGLNENNDRYSFAAAWADYDEDGWPDLAVANDFGRKNLYHNDGARGGPVRFHDAAAAAGVEDHGAGMSASWLDYDNDGRLDLYFGNMWSATGQRVTAQKAFQQDAAPAVREMYRRHARGNTLFRNRGDGRFEDVTLATRTEMGRWAWAADGFDFDDDGWADLYVANGMITNPDPSSGEVDIDGLFWRQLVAASPLIYRRGTAYDDAWRASNRLLRANGSQAARERNVFLRNDGAGRFDDISGTVGLDLDQDGRAFAVLDLEGDGDADLVVTAPRSSPQVRIFRNDLTERGASVAFRLRGTSSNRDAVGARVTVETDRGRHTRVLMAGSGYISQHSNELRFGLGKGQSVRSATVTWPNGTVETVSGVALGHRLWVEEGRGVTRAEPFRVTAPSASAAPASSASGAPASSARPRLPAAWLWQPYPAPDFTLTDLAGREHRLRDYQGRPLVLFFWTTASPDALAALAHGLGGVALLAVSVDPPAEAEKVRALARGLGPGVAVAMAGEETAGTYNVVQRFLFDRQDDLSLPTAFLLDGQGQIVKVYRADVAAATLLDDAKKTEATPAERLSRALPFPGKFYGPPGGRNEFEIALGLFEAGFEAAALPAFERAAKNEPSAITHYNLGTLYARRGQPARARAAFEQALAADPAYAEANNSLGALLAQDGALEPAVARFEAALKARPDFADALNNLGYAYLQSDRAEEALRLFQKAIEIQPDFPEAHNNLGIFHGRQGDLEKAESYFRQAVEKRPGYGEAANNLAMVLARRGERPAAIELLRRTLQEAPEFEMTYVGLARMYLDEGRTREAVQVLERLLQRNPKHPLGLQLLRQIKGQG